MLRPFCQTLMKKLWHVYCQHLAPAQNLENKLRKKCSQPLVLDHFAIIDLPGPHTGITWLSQLFTLLGYETSGKDYLSAKQNDFVWLAEKNALQYEARLALPQVVVADFRLPVLPPEIKKIIEKYSHQASPPPLRQIQQLIGQLPFNRYASRDLEHLILTYLNGRDWPLPTVSEFHTVHDFNELLAWVLIHGRKPNHFTLSIHLLDQFTSLTEFNQFIENKLNLELNHEGGVIKGGPQVGIAQSSTLGSMETITLADGNIQLPGRFIEFVWRYPQNIHHDNPILWKDFFTGFIAQHADNVIESLYLNKETT